jgi:hypothetical protein
VRVYQFRHIRVPARIEHSAPLHGRGMTSICPPARAHGPRRLGSASSASLGPVDRAAIVQGTRTPPSHGGNPGSNPGSGIGGQPANEQVSLRVGGQSVANSSERRLDEILCWEAVRALAERDDIVPAAVYLGLLERAA